MDVGGNNPSEPGDEDPMGDANGNPVVVITGGTADAGTITLTDTAASTDKIEIHTRLQAAIDAYNAKNLAGFMAYISSSYLDDGMNKTDFSAEAQEEMGEPNFESLSCAVLNISVDGNTATANVSWADGEAESIHFIKEDELWMLSGNQKKYGVEARSQNWHNGTQYMVQFEVEDPDQTATSVMITGPGIPEGTPLNLDYDTDNVNWNSWHTNKSLDFESNPPMQSLPLEYTFTIAYGEPAETFTDICMVRSFVSGCATKLSTSGTASDPLVFSWTGVGAGYTYHVQLSDADGNRIWDSDWKLTGTSVSYDGPVLTSDAQYHYWVVVEDQYGNSSFAEGSFTQVVAPGDVNNSGSVDLADAILVLQLLAGTNPIGINLGADINGDGKIGLAEAIYILQHVAGF